MLINDPKKFAIVCSTKNRPAFVRRMIASLEAQAFKGVLLIVDASEDDTPAENALTYPEVGFEIRIHPPLIRGNNWLETAEGCNTLESEFVLWHHDDDFYFLPALERAVRMLDATPEAVCAQGRELFIHALTRPDKDIYLGLGPSPRVAYLAPDPLERLRSALAQYCHLFFAVTRRQPFIETCRRVASYFPKAGIFDQYAWTCAILKYGTALLHNDLYALRQKHLHNHSRLIASLENWPLLIANPRFSDTVGDFWGCLEAAYRPQEWKAFKQIVDTGVVNLVSRALGATHMDSQLEFKLGGAFQQSERAGQLKALMRATTIGGE